MRPMQTGENQEKHCEQRGDKIDLCGPLFVLGALLSPSPLRQRLIDRYAVPYLRWRCASCAISGPHLLRGSGPCPPVLIAGCSTSRPSLLIACRLISCLRRSKGITAVITHNRLRWLCRSTARADTQRLILIQQSHEAPSNKEYVFIYFNVTIYLNRFRVCH